MRTWPSVAALAVAALALMAAAPKPTIKVEGAEVRIPAGGLPSTAAYMTLKNPSDQPDRLVGASCDCARKVTLHQSVSQNGVSRMLELKSVEIPAKGELAFTGAGRHLMIEGLEQPIRSGDKLSLVLSFERAGQVPVAFTADAMAGMEGMEGMAGMHR